MTPEERQMLGGLFQRVNAAAATPRDAEAESFINDAVRAAPHAPYVLAQTVLVQQQALEAAANRISELEAAAQQSAEQSQEHGSFLGNLGKSIFGGGAPSAPPRPDPDPQAYQRAPAPAAAAGLRADPAAGLRSGPAPGLSPASTGLSAAARPMGPAPAVERRRLPAERRFDRDGRGRRRRPWQSPGRPIRRPWRRRPLRRRRRWRSRLGRRGTLRQSVGSHGDQQLLRPRRPAAATLTSSSHSTPARRASRTPISTSSTIRPSTVRMVRPSTTAAAAPTTSEAGRAKGRPEGCPPFRTHYGQMRA